MNGTMEHLLEIYMFTSGTVRSSDSLKNRPNIDSFFLRNTWEIQLFPEIIFRREWVLQFQSHYVLKSGISEVYYFFVFYWFQIGGGYI